MSQTYSLVCHETKRRIWIGQGWGQMSVFYSGEADTMKALGNFLRTHEGKPLVLLCDDSHESIFDYLEEPQDDEVKRESRQNVG